MSDVPEARRERSTSELDSIMENLASYLGAISSVAKRMQAIPLEKRQTIEPARERAEQLLDDRKNERIGQLIRDDIETVASTAKTVALIYWGAGTPSKELLSEKQSQIAPHKEPVLACTDHILYEIDKARAHLSVLDGEPYIYPPASEPISQAVRQDWRDSETVWGEAINQRFADSLGVGALSAPFSVRQLPGVNTNNLDPGALSGALNVVGIEGALPQPQTVQELMSCPNLDSDGKSQVAQKWAEQTGITAEQAQKITGWFEAALDSDQFGESLTERQTCVGDVLTRTAERHTPDIAEGYVEAGIPGAASDEPEDAVSEIQERIKSLRDDADANTAKELEALSQRVGALTTSVAPSSNDAPSNNPSPG